MPSFPPLSFEHKDYTTYSLVENQEKVLSKKDELLNLRRQCPILLYYRYR